MDGGRRDRPQPRHVRPARRRVAGLLHERTPPTPRRRSRPRLPRLRGAQPDGQPVPDRLARRARASPTTSPPTITSTGTAPSCCRPTGASCSAAIPSTGAPPMLQALVSYQEAGGRVHVPRRQRALLGDLGRSRTALADRGAQARRGRLRRTHPRARRREHPLDDARERWDVGEPRAATEGGRRRRVRRERPPAHDAARDRVRAHRCGPRPALPVHLRRADGGRADRRLRGRRRRRRLRDGRGVPRAASRRRVVSAARPGLPPDVLRPAPRSRDTRQPISRCARPPAAAPCSRRDPSRGPRSSRTRATGTASAASPRTCCGASFRSRSASQCSISRRRATSPTAARPAPRCG